MTIRRKLFAITLCLATFAPHAMAQENAGNQNAPLEITADKTLEWYRAEQKLVARGNAMATQNGASIKAETLSANYKEGATGKYEIAKINASENVTITTQNASAYGDNATYDLDKNLATMTGKNLRMTSPDQTVTARDRFEYHVTQGKLLAIGNAVATRPNKNGGTNTLRADTISAIFTENAQGERVLKTLEAKGNVKITTPDETVTGGYGVYRANTNKAEMRGNIKITRGPNILQGKRAEIDLNTNTSKIFGGGTTNNGRVKAIFYPGSNE